MHLRNLVRFSVHWWHKVFAYMWSSWPSGTFFQLILFIAAKLEKKRRRNKQKRLRKKEKKKEQKKKKNALGKEELIFGMINVGRTGYPFLCGGIAHDLISIKFSPILFMRLKTKGKDVIEINVFLPQQKKWSNWCALHWWNAANLCIWEQASLCQPKIVAFFI